jgi:hypothetical protein
MSDDQDQTEETSPELFDKLPLQYYQYALEWCSYPRWSLEETANLLTGCVPHRPMFLKGDAHRRLDDEVLHTENQVRAAIGGVLKLVKSRKYFGKTYLDSRNIVDWALQAGIEVPDELTTAEKEIRFKWNSLQYTTPCMEAAEWAIAKFWERADLREPPSSGTIIQALLQQFPELSGEDCTMVETMTRHPLVRQREQGRR